MSSKRLFLATALSFIFLTFGGGRVCAATNAFCQPDQTVFQKVGNAFPSLDVRKTVNNMLTSSMTDGLINIVANRSPKQMMECSHYVLNQNPTQNAGLLSQINTDCPLIQASGADCADFNQTYDARIAYYNIGSQKLAFNQTTTSGSLLGFANVAEGAVRTEPLPTNLAYFWNDTIRNVPFAGSAFAAGVSYGNAPLISAVLLIWKVVRNVAFGFLAVIMLVTGIMIMMRRKLSPQLVVTAQYALPRIALAVILMVFSYPIGAVMASSMRYLTDIASGVIWGAASTTSSSLGSIIAVLFVGILAVVGVAAPLLIATAVLVVVIIILYIAVWVRAILIYMQLIVSIVFAPISFALGAVPGNESMSTNWLKRALSNVLSYIGMFTFLNVGLFIWSEIVKTPSLSWGTGVTSFFAFLLAPVIMIWILLQTLKVPGKIETFVMGDPKKPGGKR